MDISGKAQPATKFELLQAEFRKNLPANMAEIENLWANLNENTNSKDILKKLHVNLLALADAGGTFGAEEVSFVARKLDLSLKLLLSQDDVVEKIKSATVKLEKYFSQLKTTIESWLATAPPKIKNYQAKAVLKGTLVYTLLGNEAFAAESINNFEKKSCDCQHFHELNVLEAACENEKPSAIIIDDEFVDGETNAKGLEVVSYLKNKIKNCASIIYVDDLSTAQLRLDAVRAGVDRYFAKPVQINEILQSITGLSSDLEHIPYRVMVIDNDEALLKCYNAILTESEIIVEAITEPLKGFNRIDDFKPDVIVVDMYMPECSGAELVQMIRQNEHWALIPVIFLSAEQDINNQLDAMALGADDFLTKPVHANKLVATINATAERARKNVKLHRDLNNIIQENKYQLIALDEHAIVSVTDVAGRIIHVNDKLCEISGYSREELTGQNHRVLKSKVHDKEFYKNLWTTISSGKVWHGDICNTAKDGYEYWVNSTIVPFIDEKGKPYKYVSVRTDVTKLRVSEHRLKRSQEFANIGSWDWNIETGDLHWSDQIWPLFGYTKAVTDTSYDNFLAAIHPDDKQKVIDAVTNCVEKGDDYDIEHRVVWPNGEVHWVHESGDVVRNREGVPQHMLGVVQDITALKEAGIRREGYNHILELIIRDKALSKILETIVLLAETMLPDSLCSILLTDDSGKHLQGVVAPHLPDFYNKAIDGIKVGMGVGSCGEAAYSGEPVFAADIMQHPNWVKYRELAQKAGLGACWSQPFSSSSSSSSDAVLGTFAIYYHYTREPNENEINLMKELAQFAAIAVERKQNQNALLMAKEEAETANLAKSQFLSSMSHELRTPMNAIMGFSQLLNMKNTPPLTEPQEKNVNEIMMAGKHLMNLINEVLDLAKIEAGHIDLTETKVNISKVIGESLQLATPLAQKRGIEISLEKDDNILEIKELVKEQQFAWLDETRFKQVILNLLSNAVKYNKENGKIRLKCMLDGNNYYTFSITDTGKGLTSEQQKDLFKAFNRLGMEQTEIEGTGIGLVITKKIIEEMGGEIGVESELDVGTTFWIKLPLKNDAIIDRGNPQHIRKPKNLHTLESDMADEENKKSVLYIEDNPANLRLVEQIISGIPNIHMWSAPEPLLGLELAMEHLPDLILLDINLPGMDGYQVLKQLRKDEKSRGIPVLAISANAMPKDIEKGKQAGFDGYITKPVNVKELLEMVEAKLGV